jgi:hypothetical protein
VDDCKNFLSSPDNLAERAARLGWDAMAFFGCAPNRPLDYFGSAGLLWAINGGRLVEPATISRRNPQMASLTLPVG